MIFKILAKLEKRYPLDAAKAENLDEIIQVYTDVWSDSRSKEKLLQRFRRRYLDNPKSSGFASIVTCRDKDSIIGFAGFLDYEINFHGNNINAAYLTDLAVLPPYQAIGIGVLLLNALLKRNTVAMDANMNAMARKLARHMGGRDISNCIYLRRWSRPGDLLHRWTHSSFTVHEGAKIDERFDRLWDVVAEECDIIGIRNQQVLKWRYEGHPSRKFTIYTLCHQGELVAYIIVTYEELRGLFRKGILVDYLFASRSGPVITDFILYVVAALTRHGAVVVDTISTRMYAPPVFGKPGFKPKREHPDFMVYPTELSEGMPDLWCGNYWHLTLGDSDYYLP